MLVFTVDFNGEQKWASLLVKVPNERRTATRAGQERSEEVPWAFVVVAGEITQEKLELTNAMLCDWQVDLTMKKKPKAGGTKTCPYYSPSSQNKMLRTFYAHMKREYDWRYIKNNFKGWKGCVDGVLAEIYDQRLKQYVSESISF